MKIRRATDLTEQYNGMDCQSDRYNQKKKKCTTDLLETIGNAGGYQLC
jgi:hypothetical protein